MMAYTKIKLELCKKKKNLLIMQLHYYCNYFVTSLILLFNFCVVDDVEKKPRFIIMTLPFVSTSVLNLKEINAHRVSSSV